MLEDEQIGRPDDEHHDRIAVDAIGEAAPLRARLVFADRERIDVARAALVEVAGRCMMDGVAALPDIVGRQRQNAETRPIQSLVARLRKNAPCPQSCWIRNRRTRNPAAGMVIASVSQ